MGSAPSLERDCGLIGVYVCGDNLCTNAFVSVLVNTRRAAGARRRQILLFWAPNGLPPCAKTSSLGALDGFTATYFTASPPAISLMMLLSNVVTQKSTETLLSPLCSTRTTIRHPRFSKHSPGAAHHSQLTEFSS